MAHRFVKMHGLGNDFVVLDARQAPLSQPPLSLTGPQARAIADRHFGVGCDQLIVLEKPVSLGADVFMRILNPDGSPAGACGNATRCVAALVAGEAAGVQRDRLTIETISGLLPAIVHADGTVTVDMGPACLDWRDIPLAVAADTLALDLAAGPLSSPCAVSMGNPHAVFFVEDATAVDLAHWGPVLENAPLFPQRANIEVVSPLAPGRLRMRVWERGAGITLACGSGACATLVAAARRGVTGDEAEVVMDGGSLTIRWRRADGHVLMTGPVARVFSGELSPELLAVPT